MLLCYPCAQDSDVEASQHFRIRLAYMETSLTGCEAKSCVLQHLNHDLQIVSAHQLFRELPCSHRLLVKSMLRLMHQLLLKQTKCVNVCAT